MVDVDSFWGILQLQHFQLGDAQSLYERGVFFFFLMFLLAVGLLLLSLLLRVSVLRRALGVFVLIFL